MPRAAGPRKAKEGFSLRWQKFANAGHLEGLGLCFRFPPSHAKPPRSMHPSPNNVGMLRGKSASRLIGVTLHWRIQRRRLGPAEADGEHTGSSRRSKQGWEVGWWGIVLRWRTTCDAQVMMEGEVRVKGKSAILEWVKRAVIFQGTDESFRTSPGFPSFTARSSSTDHSKFLSQGP